MEASAASRTALGTALMRALHTRADPLPIIADPWGDRLVPDYVLVRMRERARAEAASGAGAGSALQEGAVIDAWLRASPAYTTVITRTRYAEDALREAIARGVTQYVLIGAGFDSYALRAPAEARHVRIFEVDHPATQALKRQRLSECGVPVPGAVRFLPADLAAESLRTVLSRSAFDPAEPAFFSWLGVTMYLTREANVASLRSIADCAPAGSELVFTYVDQAAFRSEAVSGPFADLQRAVTSVGEPFISGFDPGVLARELESVGLDLVEDLTDAQLVERYDPLGLNGFRPSPQSRIARARIAERRAGSA